MSLKNRRLAVYPFADIQIVGASSAHLTERPDRAFQPLGLFFENPPPGATLADFRVGQSSAFSTVEPMPLSMLTAPACLNKGLTANELWDLLAGQPNRPMECHPGSVLQVLVRSGIVGGIIKARCWGLEWEGDAPVPLRVDIREVNGFFSGHVLREKLVGEIELFRVENVTRESAERMVTTYVQQQPARWY